MVPDYFLLLYPGSSNVMNKILNIQDHDAHFRSMINQNIDFINRQCLKAVKMKSGGFLKGELSIENEADRLFNRVLDKLSENDFSILRKFESRSKFSTYLTTIIVRTAIDMIRERAGRQRSETDHVTSRSGKIPDTYGTPVREGKRSGEAGEYYVADTDNIPELKVIGTDRLKKMTEVITLLFSSLSGEEKLMLRMKFPADPGVEPMSTKKTDKSTPTISRKRSNGSILGYILVAIAALSILFGIILIFINHFFDFIQIRLYKFKIFRVNTVLQ